MHRHGKTPRIFVSSTFRDFEKFRDDLFRVSRQIDQEMEAMEFFGALAGEPLDVCLKKLETCKIYLGIIGQTYGTIEKKKDKSFTQLEYEHAFKLYRKNRLQDIWIFLPSDECHFPVRDVEKEPKKLRKLTEFFALVRRHNVVYYNSLEDLKLKVVIQCFKLMKGSADQSMIEEPDYDYYLDSTYGIISIAGIDFLPSIILRTLDEVAYRQGFLEWQGTQKEAENKAK